MRRKNYFSETFGLDPEVPVHELEIPEKEKTERDRICDLVFVADPRTGLPSSDIGMYMNPSTPPQVKDYIQQNLFGEPRQSSPGSLGVDDDTLIYMTRRSNETVDEYIGRVNHFMIAQKKSVQDQIIADYASRRRAELKDK